MQNNFSLAVFTEMITMQLLIYDLRVYATGFRFWPCQFLVTTERKTERQMGK